MKGRMDTPGLQCLPLVPHTFNNVRFYYVKIVLGWCFLIRLGIIMTGLIRLGLKRLGLIGLGSLLFCNKVRLN